MRTVPIHPVLARMLLDRQAAVAAAQQELGLVAAAAMAGAGLAGSFRFQQVTLQGDSGSLIVEELLPTSGLSPEDAALAQQAATEQGAFGR